MQHCIIASSLALVLAFGATSLGAQGPANDGVPEIGQVSRDSVWVPTPERMIRRLLQIADTTRSDLVMDLGSGDGRVPIYAARHFGARAVGVELEENLVRLSIASARAQGVGHLVKFLRQDLFDADLSRANVIALYLSPGAMIRLRPQLLRLAPGTRIVSHQFTLEDWESDETVRVEGRMGYLWVVPADISGAWDVTAPDEKLQVRIEQKFQKLVTTGERAGKPVSVIGAQLRGTEVRFTAFDRDGIARRYVGRIDGARMAGTASADHGASLRWGALRR